MSTDRGIYKEDVVNIRTMEYYRAVKQNERMPFAATWMDLKIVMLGEVSQTDKETYDIPYMWNIKKDDENELIYKVETDSQS